MNTAGTSFEIAVKLESHMVPHISRNVAKNILENREKLGGFTNLQQLLEVPGVEGQRFSEIVRSFEMETPPKIPRTTITIVNPDLSFKTPVADLEIIEGHPNLDRLQYHKMVLQYMGINDLSSLGRLTLSGNIIPQRGLTTAHEISEVNVMSETVFDSAYSAKLTENGNNHHPKTVYMEAMGGTANALKAIPFHISEVSSNKSIFDESSAFTPLLNLRGRANPSTIPIDTAYWAASWIDLSDNTNVIIKEPLHSIVIITEKLTVGSNVTFTWERPRPDAPAIPVTPQKKGPAATPDGIHGVTGEAGEPGRPGNKGPDGASAPEIELWLLDMTGTPMFDLKGQDAYNGGTGGNGGQGGDGSKGRVALLDDWGFCKSGPGNGGDGGQGGKAGDGGPGGDGGDGGKLSIFAPRTILNNLNNQLFANVIGGAGGFGGSPGLAGLGGNGGQVGDNPRDCPATSGPRTAGTTGKDGASGVIGKLGKPGDNGVINTLTINENDFRRELLRPAIINISPGFAKEGDEIIISGSRFTPTDTVILESKMCERKIISDTRLTFKVPVEVMGGTRIIQVKQSDGTLSNKATIYILPTLTSTQPTGRIKAGSTIALLGSGFVPNIIVRVNNEDMPNVVFKDANKLDFTLIRPSSVIPNASGENVLISVLLPDGKRSNDITIVLDTFNMIVLGDSVTWGQGLNENEKFHSLVQATIRQGLSNIGVYKTVLTHSGAIIGVGDNTTLPSSLPGEVPTSYPTILQQCDLFAGDPKSVDLVLVNGGINDINVRKILNPNTPTNDIKSLTSEHCHDNMKVLLDKIWDKFENAKVIVTGYPLLVSEESDSSAFEALLIATGVIVGGLIYAAALGGFVAAVIDATSKAKIISNSKTFHDESTTKLRAAVDEINAQRGSVRIFFADPAYGPRNAFQAPDTWLFGLNLPLSPEDSIAPSREVDCVGAGLSGTDLTVCKIASIGHPNITGAQQYANVITPLL